MSDVQPARRDGLRNNLIWTTLSAGVSQGSLVLINIAAARLLGSEDVAIFMIVLALSTLVPAVFSFGMERLGVVILANRDVRRTGAVVAPMRRLSWIGSLGAGLATAAATSVLVTTDSILVRTLIALAVLAENARIMVGDLPRAWGRADLAALSGPALPRLFLLVFLLAQFVAPITHQLDVLLGAQALLSASAALVGWVTVRRLANSKWSSDLEYGSVGTRMTVLSLLRQGWPLSVANSGLSLLNQVDTLVVAIFFDPVTMAGYALVSRLSNLVGNVKTMLNVALLPTISRRPRSGAESRMQVARARRAMALLVATLTVPVVGFLMYADAAVAWLFGAEYASVAHTAWFLAGGQMMSVAFGLAGTFLLREGKQRAIMWIQLGSATVATALMVGSAALGSITLLAAASGFGTGICALAMALHLWKTAQIPSWCGFAAEPRIARDPQRV